VVAPFEVPSIITFAKGIASLFRAFLTLPYTLTVWAFE
jgi:hypothetical protein